MFPPVAAWEELIFLTAASFACSVDASPAERPPGLYAWYVQSDNVEVPLGHAHEHYPDALFIQWKLGEWSTVGEVMALHSRYPKVAKTGLEAQQAGARTK